MLVEKEFKIEEQEKSISAMKGKNSVNEKRIKELENELKALKGRPSKELKMGKHKSQHQNRRALFGGGSSDKDSDEDGLEDQDEAKDSEDEGEEDRQGLAMSMGARG